MDFQREAFSARGVQRTYGISRDFVGAAIRSGALPAMKVGRRFLILRSDLEAWLRVTYALPASNAERRVAEVLSREAS